MQSYTKFAESEYPLISQRKVDPLTSSQGTSLDTLAQLNQSDLKKGVQTLTSRALSKVITGKYLYPLIDLKSELCHSYWNTWHCVEQLNQSEDGKITSKYCNNRWCLVCNRIRTGKMVNGYSPVIEKWNDLQFLTLTRPNVFDGLKGEYESMQIAWSRAKQRLKRNGLVAQGIRKNETTWRQHSGYNCHYHIIVDGEDYGKALIDEWLNLNSTANRRGQDQRKGDADTVKEMFKYMTKLWKTTKDEDGNVKHVIPYPPQVMDYIFQSMKGKRSIQPFGGVKRVSEEVEDLDANVFLAEARTCTWDWHKVGTWVDVKTGELRTEAQEPDVELAKPRIKPKPYGQALKQRIREQGEVKKFA